MPCAEKKKTKKDGIKWTRTTVLIRDDHLEKFKVLAWWEKATLKELFDEMIDSYLSSKQHIHHLVEERKKSLEQKK